MIDPYYICYSGLQVASDGLDLISDNMANMNTPGFKETQAYFSSLGGNYTGLNTFNDGNMGYGAYRSSVMFDFTPGDLRQVGDSGNNAIDGQGFFTENFHGEMRYTRDGEFQFDDGVLVDDRTKAHIQGYDDKGNLVDINVTDAKTNPGKADTSIKLKGEIDPKQDKDKNWLPVQQTLQIYGSDGKLHKINVKLTPKKDGIPIVTGPKDWTVEITDENGMTLPINGNDELSFSAAGIIDKDHSSITFQFRAKDCKDTEVTLNFGSPDDPNNGVRCNDYPDSQTKDSKIDVSEGKDSRDGYGIGDYKGFTVDDKGVLYFEYTNGQKVKGATLALARFDHPQQLQRIDNNAFVAPPSANVQYGRAGEGVFGHIKSGYIELSNVNSSVEFANIVVFQRIFQASSEILQIDKQLLEKLYGAPAE